MRTFTACTNRARVARQNIGARVAAWWVAITAAHPRLTATISALFTALIWLVGKGKSAWAPCRRFLVEKVFPQIFKIMSAVRSQLAGMASNLWVYLGRLPRRIVRAAPGAIRTAVVWTVTGLAFSVGVMARYVSAHEDHAAHVKRARETGDIDAARSLREQWRRTAMTRCGVCPW